MPFTDPRLPNEDIKKYIVFRLFKSDSRFDLTYYIFKQVFVEETLTSEIFSPE